MWRYGLRQNTYAYTYNRNSRGVQMGPSKGGPPGTPRGTGSLLRSEKILENIRFSGLRASWGGCLKVAFRTSSGPFSKTCFLGSILEFWGGSGGPWEVLDRCPEAFRGPFLRLRTASRGPSGGSWNDFCLFCPPVHLRVACRKLYREPYC